MPAATFDLDIEQGANFSKVITWKDSAGVAQDLTGYTARMQIRKSKSATTTLADMTTANGGVTLGGVLGTITLALTAAQTAAMTSGGVYDLELINGAGFVTRLLEGAVTFSKEVTR